MKDRSKSNIKTKIVNFFGGCGYLGNIVQWLFSILLFFEPIKDFVIFITPEVQTDNKVVLDAGSLPEPFLLITGLVITAIVVILCVLVIIKLPHETAKNSTAVVHGVAKNTAPILLKLQHKKNTTKNKLKLTSEIVFYIKMALIIAPVFLAYASRFLSYQNILPEIALIVSLFLAIVSMSMFGISYLLAYLCKITPADVW